MMNKCTFIGRVCHDPEMSYMPNGNGLLTNSLAVTKKWKSKDGQQQEKTTFINFTIFGKLAEIVNQYSYKGQLAYIEGEFDTSETEKDGVKRYFTKIIVNDFKMLSFQPKESDEQYANSTTGAKDKKSRPQSNLMDNYDIKTDSNFTSDDIPF